MSTRPTRPTDRDVRDVLALLRQNNPVPLDSSVDASETLGGATAAGTGLDFRAQSDLDRILIGDLTPRTDLDATAAADAGTSTVIALPLWRRPVPRVLAAATAVAAAGVIAVAGLSSPGAAPVAYADTPPALVIHAPAATEDGAATLNRLADLAAAQPAPAPAPFQYLESINYNTVTAVADGRTTVFVAPSRTRMWVSPTTGAARWTSVSAGGSNAWSSDGIIDPTLIDPAGEYTNEDTMGPSETTFALPTDPQALRAVLEASGHTPDGGLVRGYLDDLYNRFSKTLPSPAQQAAMWRLLASTGQLKTLGTTTDRAGRPAVALSYDTTGTMAGQERYQLLIDPVTGLLLGHEEIALKTSPLWAQHAPAVMGASTYLVSTGVATNTTVPADNMR